MGIFGKKKEEKKDDVVAKKAVEKKDTKKTSKKSKKVSKTDNASTAAAYGVIVAPIITEKTHTASEEGKYVFRVAKNATKQQVKNVIEEMYGVNVVNVNTVVVKPKRRTVKYDRGYQKLYKKAIVTLQKGETIAVFEGV